MKNFILHIKLKLIIITLFSFNTVEAQNIDVKLLDKLNNGDSVSFSYKTMVGFTNSVLPISAALPIGLFIKGVAEKDKEQKWQALRWALTFAGTSAITAIVKYSVNRERPFNDHAVIIQKFPTHDPSYPSGHTSSAFAIATTLTMTYPKWYVIIPSYGWAGTVAYSRMYLGVHYPSDVIGGVAIGIGTAFLSKKINDKLREKKKIPPDIID